MKKLLITIIKFYKFIFSPVMPNCCRFSPSCSEYSIEALNKHGAFKGSLLTIKRVFRCHPFHPGGFDPVK